MELQTLYRRGASGKPLQWRIWSEGADIFIEHGQVGGKLQVSRNRAEGKNIGKANETTPERQAEIEILAEWNHQQDLKYKASIDDVNNFQIDAMLAPNEKWIGNADPKKDTFKYAVYPCDIQPKYDGARCLAFWQDGRIVLMTRGRKEWGAVPHIISQLEKILPDDGTIFDGELYFHGVKRQRIQKWITKHYPESAKIQLMVYDVPMCAGEEKPWDERRKDLERLIPGEWGKADAGTPNIVRSITMQVNNGDEVMAFHNTCVDHGYEGAMVRNRKGMYAWGRRPKDLLKVKAFEDDEFEVIGCKQATGDHDGCVIWRCKVGPKQGPVGSGEFWVVPNGSLEERREWFRDAASFYGKPLTVKFQGYSEDGLPQIAKGIAFRLDEDK